LKGCNLNEKKSGESNKTRRNRTTGGSKVLRVKKTDGRLIILLLFLMMLTAGPASGQAADEFSSLMDKLVNRISDIESAYNPLLAGNIARTRRLEIFSRQIGEIEVIAGQAAVRSDANSLKLWQLTEAARSMDPTSDEFRPILEELWVRSIMLECTDSMTEVQTVSDYIKSQAATFVADRGDFSHPGFDESVLTSEDRVRIFFCGFGLVVLVHMEGGVEAAVELYRQSGDLEGYYANQLVFRGVDLDVDGLPMLEAVINDPESLPQYNEIYYGMIAGKLLGSGSQFGSDLVMSPEWCTTISGMVYGQIRIPERLDARREAPFYGVDFEGESLGPESLLGLLGPVAVPTIIALLDSDSPMENVSGLEALRWFDVTMYPGEAGELFGYAEPLMGSSDLMLAVLGMESFDADARYTGEPYDEERLTRLRWNLPIFCDLMDRVLEHPALEYLDSTAWLDIYMEGTLKDELIDCMPMVVQVINSDWSSAQEGEDVYLPEGELDLVSYFIPVDTGLFEDTQATVLGFLVRELDTNSVNPFRVWTYVNYLEAAKFSGVEISDGWRDAIMRLRAWVEGTSALVDGEALKTVLDGLVESAGS